MLPRLYISTPIHDQNQIRLDQQAGRYLLRVLRLGPGSAVALFDNSGHEYACTLLDRDNKPTLSIDRISTPNREAPFEITLVHGLTRTSALEMIIQKGVELGVSRFIPLKTQRSTSRPDAKLSANRLQRLHRIAQEAAEQCQRVYVPEILAPIGWNELDRLLQPGPRLLFWEENQHAHQLKQLTHPDPLTTLTLLTGPEGGLDAAEVSHAQQEMDFSIITLGPRILRAETAAITAVSAVLTLWGDLG
ncbi:MAG: 16S rRNA (uracil(1498)-N(3))-methyltransferase [Magnetococcales bacterium]|nr:16S rRNA (uracil(1498)-N(3))-methyltransferase [Magnetococcales bacterium]